MKNLLTITLLLFALNVSAQTAGLIVQPEFKTSNIRKGFFVQSEIYKELGLYSDFKMLKTTDTYSDLNFKSTKRVASQQWNAGISYRVIEKLTIIASRSIVNTEKESFTIENDYFGYPKHNVEPTYQFAAMYSESFLSVLLGYEIQQNATSKRITFGLGFNF